MSYTYFLVVTSIEKGRLQCKTGMLNDRIFLRHACHLEFTTVLITLYFTQPVIRVL